MLFSVKGTLIHLEPNIAVIESGGIGYKCNISGLTQNSLPKLGEETKLYTHLYVREDAIELFGFNTLIELTCFKMLTSISGVGAKVGLAMLSILTPQQIAVSIACNDVKTLTLAAGVGNKLAQRIILELKDKVSKSKDYGLNSDNKGALEASNASSNVAQAINALAVLGYLPGQTAGVVASLDSSLPVEELIRLSLKRLGG